MKFKQNIWGYLKLGAVFIVFMVLISFLFSIIILPVIFTGIGISFLFGMPTSGSDITVGLIPTLGIFAVILVMSILMIGWAVFFFYKKNTFMAR